MKDVDDIKKSRVPLELGLSFSLTRDRNAERGGAGWKQGERGTVPATTRTAELQRDASSIMHEASIQSTDILGDTNSVEWKWARKNPAVHHQVHLWRRVDRVEYCFV